MLTTEQAVPRRAAREGSGYSAYLLEPVEVAQFYDALAEVTGRSHRRHGAAGASARDAALLAESRRGRLRILLVEDDP